MDDCLKCSPRSCTVGAPPASSGTVLFPGISGEYDYLVPIVVMSIRCLPQWRSPLPCGLCPGGVGYGVTGGDELSVFCWHPHAQGGRAELGNIPTLVPKKACVR